MRHPCCRRTILVRMLVLCAVAGVFADRAFAQSASVVFAGTSHDALGVSTLSLDATRTVLTIDGLTANGGGATYALDAEAGAIRFGDGIRGARPSSGQWTVRATYRSGGGSSGEVHGGLGPNGPNLSFDHAPVGTNSVKATLHREGQAVASFVTSPVVTLPVDEWPAEVELGIDDGEMQTSARWEIPIVVFLPDGNVVDCDAVEVVSQTGGQLSGEELGTMRFEGHDLDAVQILGERFRDDGSWFEVAGNLKVSRSPLGHELTHVVQQDAAGTYVEYGPSPCFPPEPVEPTRATVGLRTEALLSQGAPAIGTRLDFLVYGVLDDAGVSRIPSHTAEWTSPQESDPGMTLIGGFLELGAQSWTVQVFDDGVLVDAASGLAAAVAHVGEYVGQHNQVDLDFLHQRAAAHVDLGGDQAVTLLTDPPRSVVGDRVHIIPEQIQIFPDCVRAVGARLTKVSDVTLKRGVIGSSLPPARVDGLALTPFGDAVVVREPGGTGIANAAWGPLASGPLSGGVRGSMAGLRGFRWDVAGDLDPQSAPEGSMRSYRLSTEDVTGQTGSAGLDVIVENGKFAIAHDLDDLGSSDADVVATRDGEVVYTGVLAQQGRLTVDADFDEASVYELPDGLWAFELAWDAPVEIVFDDGSTVFADRVSERLRHRDRAITIWDYEHLALDSPGTTIGRVSVRPRGAWWSGLGDMAFGDFTQGPVLIDLFDPGVASGVDVESEEDPQGTPFVEMILPSLEQYDVLDGDEVVTLEVDDTSDSGKRASSSGAGVLSLTRQAGSWSAAIDFSATGSTGFRVLVDGVGEVASSTTPTGVAFTCDEWPEHWIVRGSADGIWMDLGYPVPVQVTVPGIGSWTTRGVTVATEGAGRPGFGGGHARFLFEGLSKVALALTESAVGVDRPGPIPRGRGTIALDPPVPNPFNPRTSLGFALDRPTNVRLTVVDVAGRTVRTLVDAHRGAGRHRVVWDGVDDRGHAVASGVYFVHAQTADASIVAKVVLVR